MRILALDIGNRRTGIAFCDTETGVPLPLTSLSHRSLAEFVEQVGLLVKERHIERFIVGLPLLLSGKEGAQSTSVREAVAALSPLGLPVEFLDERFTTPQKQVSDGDAMAACSILLSYLERNDI